MKVRLILIGMAAGLLLPLAAANAGAVFNPGMSQVGAGTDVGRGTAPIAENFWRAVGDHDDNDNDHGKGDCDHKCDKSPSKNRGHDCDNGNHGNGNHGKGHDCDKDDHNGNCDKDDNKGGKDDHG
jgi:hypothetical protein